MALEVRLVEMYVGVGSDCGTWDTNYVEIPRNTPDDKISEVAIEKAKEEFSEIAFVGVYSIPTLESLDEILE